MFLAYSGDVVKFGLSFFEVSQSDDGSCLLVDQLAESSFVLDNGVRDVHALAKSREENDIFNRVDIASDKNQLSLFLFNEVGNVVQTVFETDGLVALLGVLLSSFSLGGSSKSVSFLFSGFGGVFSEDSDKLVGWVKI